MREIVRIAGAGLLAAAGAVAVAAGADAPAGAYAVRSNFQLGGPGRWDLLAVDSARGHVFISRSDHVDVVDAKTGARVGSIAGTDGVHGIAVAPKLGRGFATNGRANSLTEFDLERLERVRDIPLSGASPDAIVFEPRSGRLIVFNAKSNNASVVDPKSGAELGTIGFDGNPELAVDDGAGRVYVNIEDKAQLVAIDAGAAKVVATWALDGCEEPTGLAIDAKHARLFSACQNRRMIVTDAKSGRQVAQLPIGEGPDGAAFDPATRDAFSAEGKSGTLTIVHEDDAGHFRVAQTLATQPGARTIALDPATHRLYLPTARFGPPTEPGKRPEMLPDSFVLLVVSR